MSVRLRLIAAALAACAAHSAQADPLPTPTGDFALKAKTRDGGTLDLAHSGGRMRLEMLPKAAPAMVVGLLDLRAGKMVVMVPAMPKMAVQMDLPPDFTFASMNGSGTKTGSAEVAGEPCDLWKVDATASQAGTGPTVSCITADGIALRTEMDIKGKTEVLYEVTSLTRGPQDPRQFVLPTGVQTVKIPKNAAAALPGLAPFTAGLGTPSQ
ncbi:hypothetical protein [Azorhizobium doebereinerae]|uniref:hypothetical protein n=1 Tax=Azorhizobium doebereinerae TaxID=281091 RepID=UPI0003F7679D|nr:hypothetical protein [Azorhizobium doebereinerae]